jgi:hypothetical protein
MLLSTAYFPPTQYFCCLLASAHACMEAHEHYVKQTYRSRCHILAANGVLALTVPVAKTHGAKMPIRDVRIDYSTAWQRQHWRSLTAAYNSSPFFLYYADELEPLFRLRETFLFDLNLRTTQALCDLLEIRTSIGLTERYLPANSGTLNDDYRYRIIPKKSERQPLFAAAAYYQTFAQKFGFVPNLSILDLLFNEGTEALSALKKSCLESQAKR